MAIARWKDLCIDVVDVELQGPFWAAALGLQWDSSSGSLIGSTPAHRVWLNVVPEPKTVKNRAHLDVHSGPLEELVALGASVSESFPRWTVMLDPEGQEFCAFVRDEVPDYRMYEIVIDTDRPQLIAQWWAQVFGAEVVPGDEDDWAAIDIDGLPFEGLVFGKVPEPKTVKNRVHFDVRVQSLQPLLDVGAVLLRELGGDIRWSVLADPDGNEFCAFLPE